MSKYVDANPIMNYLATQYNENKDKDPVYAQGIECGYCAVESALNSNFVEIVRCKNCIYRKKFSTPNYESFRCSNPDYGMASGVDLKDNDFCSYGESNTK